MCRTAALLLALSFVPGCSLLAPSDEALMGERRTLPSNVPPEPPLSDGLVFWLDGATGVETVADDDSATPKIERWRDLAGNGHDATQSESGRQPAWIDDNTARRRAILFSAGAQLVIADVALGGQGFTLLLLAQPLLYASTDVPFAFGSDGPRLVGEDDLDLSFRITAVDMNENDIDIPFAWVPARTTLTVAQLTAEGVGSARIDGHAVTETRTVEPISGSFEVVLGSSAAMMGVVGLYDRVLDEDEVAELERAMRERWACCEP